MKQLVWSPSSINFGSKKKGESATAESTLSITEGSALLTPGKISPLPGADYPVQIKNTEGNLHIHPAFIFAAARYYLTSAGVLTTNRDIAELYLGNAGAGSGLPFLPVPLTLVITTPPGEFEPEDPLTINYTSSAVLWVKVFFKVNDSEWFFYDIFNATGTFDMDISEWGFSHGDILTIKVQDDESTSFYDTVDLTAMVKNIVIDSIGTLYLIGEFEDGVDYYATPDGEITTDITGIYLGVGNADGDIDLDIIEYAVEITSPLDSADIALDVPFTFEATTNVQDGRTLHVVAYQGELSVILDDELTISGGAITKSVTVSESDGFTTGAVQLLAWYSPLVSTITAVDVTVHTATITNVTSTPASPEPATNFVFSGESTYLVGEELTLQYSTDDSTWLPLGVATVQPDGTWSKSDCQIADAGTYYLRAVYDTDKVESASISVVVASGVKYYTYASSSNTLYAFDGYTEKTSYNLGYAPESVRVILEHADYDIVLAYFKALYSGTSIYTLLRFNGSAFTKIDEKSFADFGIASLDYVDGIFWQGLYRRASAGNCVTTYSLNPTADSNALTELANDINEASLYGLLISSDSTVVSLLRGTNAYVFWQYNKTTNTFTNSVTKYPSAAGVSLRISKMHHIGSDIIYGTNNHSNVVYNMRNSKTDPQYGTVLAVGSGKYIHQDIGKIGSKFYVAQVTDGKIIEATFATATRDFTQSDVANIANLRAVDVATDLIAVITTAKIEWYNLSYQSQGSDTTRGYTNVAISKKGT